jgi:hypothetical protein
MKGNFITVIALQLGITGAGYANPSQLNHNEKKNALYSKG